MAHFVVVYDACVLFSAPLCDLLMELALADLFQAKWSDQIHEEWIKNALAKRDHLTRDKLDYARQKMGLFRNPRGFVQTMIKCLFAIKPNFA